MRFFEVSGSTSPEDVTKNIDLIGKIKFCLENKWGMVYYSDSLLEWYPEYHFNLYADYDIWARRIWLYLMKKPDKSKFVKNMSECINGCLRSYKSPCKGKKRRTKLVLRKIYDLVTDDDFKYAEDQYIQAVRRELRQKYRSHCCGNLDDTDNAERRYFFRHMIVYVREINAYVLTNKRRYVYNSEKDEYTLNQDLFYEILDYCPFCGCDLKSIRLENERSHELIIEAINKWRDCGEGIVVDEKTEYKITNFNVNLYDSHDFIGEILTEKYVNFDNEYGVDHNGNINKHGNFITVDKILDLRDKYDIYGQFYVCNENYDILQTLKNGEISKYVRQKFRNRETFSQEEARELCCFLTDFMHDMYHNPERYEELYGEV